MRLRQTQIFGLAAGVLLLALLPPSACKRRSLGEEDGGGGGQGGSAGGLASLDAGGGQGGLATGGRGGTGAPPDAAADVGADVGRDMAFEGPPPPPGEIPCGNTSCDPARQFCEHWVGGLAPDVRRCQPLPSACVPGGSDCSCIFPDGGLRCFTCRVVSGTDVSGLELDCPGPIG